MRKVFKTNEIHEQGGLRILVAVILAMTLTTFGCTTNQNAGYGEPSRTPAAGPMAPSSTATPGSSSGTTGIPVTMVSSYGMPATSLSTGVDAIAVLEANRGYQGRVLGPADPGGPIVVNGQVGVNQLSSQTQSTPFMIGGDVAADGVVLPSGAVVTNTGTDLTGTVAVGANTNLGLAATSQTGATTLGNVVATPVAGSAATLTTGTGTVTSGGLTVAPAAATNTTTASNRVRAATSAARTTTATSGGVPVRILSNGGGVIVTNQSAAAVNQLVTARRGISVGVTNTNATTSGTTNNQ